MLKAVIFDMDGVLVDTEPTYDKHLIKYLKTRFDIDVDKNFFDDKRGLSSHAFWEKVLIEFNLTHSMEEIVTHARQTYYEFLIKNPILKPIDGISELIDSLLKANIPIAVASSASLRRINMMFETSGLLNKFKVITCADDVEKGKPHPDIYLKAAEKLGVNPKDCIAIEDATNGVKSAKSAGMKVIAFKDPIHNQQDLSEANLIIKNFSELDLKRLQKFFS